MSVTTEIQELESARRKSARAIPVDACLLGLAAAVLWFAYRFFTIPVVVIVIVLGLTSFTLVGDMINYYVCGRRLQRLRSERET